MASCAAGRRTNLRPLSADSTPTPPAAGSRPRRSIWRPVHDPPDPETIASLKALDDGDGFFAEMVQTFLSNMRPMLEHRRVAHKLCNIASAVGAAVEAGFHRAVVVLEAEPRDWFLFA